MGRNFHSIERLNQILSGRLRTALAATLWISGPALAWEASLSSQTWSSHGLMDTDHWIQQPLRLQPHAVDIVFRKDLALTRPVSFGELTLSHSTRGFYQGDANVLTAMALNALPGAFPLPTTGRYPLQARSQQLVSNDLGLARSFELAASLKLEGRIRLSYVLDYQRTLGQAELRVDARDARLEGQIRRWGTRRYGYLVDDQADAGQGVGVDAKLHWQPGPWQVQARVENLWNHLRLNPMHFSERIYDVRARDGELVIRTGNDFSMTGTYGLTRASERLPAWTQISVQHAAWPSMEGGLLQLNQRWIPWLSYRTAPARWLWGLSSVGGRNFTLEGLWSPANGTQWGLGLTWTADGRAALGQFQIRWPL